MKKQFIEKKTKKLIACKTNVQITSIEKNIIKIKVNHYCTPHRQVE